jgi:hypothetical protein
MQRQKKLPHTIAFSMLSIVLVLLSCKETPDTSTNTESSLIMKINAVQEQIMAQGNISEEEEQAILSLCSIMSHDDGLANFSPDYRMILKDADTPPVFEGCEELSKEKTRACFDTKVAAFIKREFNILLAQDLKLTEPKQVDAFFIIDDKGNLTGMKVRNSEVTIQAEILRVLRKMPVMIPAIHHGERVSVLCSMVVTYGDAIDIDLVYIPERPTNQ